MLCQLLYVAFQLLGCKTPIVPHGETFTSVRRADMHVSVLKSSATTPISLNEPERTKRHRLTFQRRMIRRSENGRPFGGKAAIEDQTVH